jgi:hypothetical protein
MRNHHVTALTGRELEQARRELAASLALARPGSPARVPILTQMKAIDAELAGRSGARPGELPGSPLPLILAGQTTGREDGLICELEAPADPADPAAQAYRARIRARYAELYAERTRTETQLTAQHAAAPPDTDPALLDTLPTAARVLASAPDKTKEALMAAFDIHALYNKDMNQVTIWATITSDTPRTIAALLADPRTDHDTGHGPTPPPDSAPAQAPVS